jgi:DNA helicase-2/ATP-dependent DNA helicase PcrA
MYSLAVNSGAPIDRVLAKHFPQFTEWAEELRTLFAQYTDAKQQQNVLDYDDLLLYWAEMLEDDDLAAQIGGRFDHVLVDEYQDTNRLQSKILMRLKPTGRGLMVVGDDAQAIYSFRASTVRNILDFPNQFEPKARVITLEQNYRSTQPILKACNAVIGLAKERFTKNLRSDRRSKQLPFLTTVMDESSQARHVTQQILKAREAGVVLKSQAVLFRASHHSAQLEIELTRKNIPFKKYGGLKFLEAAHVKDVISVLRWCENSRDKIAGFRILQLLPGIGPSTAAKIFGTVQRERNVGKALSKFSVPKATAEDWPGFVKLIASVRKGEHGWPAEFELVRKWYEPQLVRLFDDAANRAGDIVQLELIAAGYKSRQRFLTELTLDPPEATTGEHRAPVDDEDYLTLSTIHSAKGREWKSVHILNVVDGCIPSDRADDLEEERRLLHVAMTRAKDFLNLIVPLRFYTYRHSNVSDRHMYASVSQFIPEHLQSLFERRTWTDHGSQPQVTRRPSVAEVDITSRLKERWG